MQVGMPHTPLFGQRVLQHRHVQAIIVIEMDMHAGHGQAVTAVQGICKPLRQSARLVIVE